MKHLKLLTFLFIFIISAKSNAQMARLYTSESGLANSQINSIYQDKRGFIWISTENGLSRFDGMNFMTFRFDRNKPSSIASNTVITTYEDSDNVFWVGTSAGLQTFSSEYNTFTKITLEDASVPNSDQHISSIMEIESDGETKILATSSGHGVYVLDKESHKIDHALQNIINSNLPSNFINRTFMDSSKRLWVSFEDGGLVLLDLTEEKIRKDIWGKGMDAIENDIFNSFTEDEESGDIFIGSFNNGLLIYDSENGSIRKAKDKSAGDCRVISFLKNNIAPQYGENTYLAGLENEGIKLFDPADETMKEVKFSNISYDISSWKVHNLIEDNQGNVWAGAYQTGVMVIPKSMYGFDYLPLNTYESRNSYSSCVTSIIEDKERECMWIGTDGAGIFKIDRNGRTTNFSSADSGLSNNSIMSLALDKRGKLWIATYLGGIATYTRNEGIRPFKEQDKIATNKTVCLEYSEEEDIIYVGTHGNGFSVIDAQSEAVLRTWADNDNKWLSTLYLDRSGLLWIGTYNGPMAYDNRVMRLLQYDINDELSTRVYAFCEDNDGKLWIGTGEGLVGFDRSAKTTVSYTESDGLPSNAVTNIVSTDDGNLWISTLNGLSRFCLKTEEFKNYYHYDGLQENEFHLNAALKGSDGRLWFGGIQGITSFYPHIVDQRSHPVPPLYLSNLTVMNRSIDYDPSLGDENILDKHITEASHITLPSNSEIFSLEFSVLEYTNPKKITYSYMMEGFEKEWNRSISGSRTITYTNLPSGKYIMKAMAYFEGEPDEYSYREIGIRIMPPWYMSVWAWIIYAMSGILMIMGMTEYRHRRKALKEKQHESEIKELRLQMFTNISHEIRTPLTLVMTPLKKLREAEQDPKQKDLYNLMYRNSLRVLRLVNQLLDMRKVDNGQMHLHFLETDVVYFIRDIMQSFDNLAVSRNIRFSIIPEEEIVNLWIDQGNFDKIIFNILSNAFKYTPDTGEIKIYISSALPNNGILESNISEFVEFIIYNSGSKIEEKDLDRLFDRFFQVDVTDSKVGSGVGLNLAKMLVELHHGEISAYNTEEGIAFRIRIPVGCSHLNASEMTKPTNHKDLYTKTMSKLEEHSSSREDVTYNIKDTAEDEVRQGKARRKIILVDDDGEMRAYLKHELQSIYNVEVAADGKEAWAKISTTIPDAVITDLMMGGMDGAELCGKIKKNPGTNHIPVILLTSSTDEQKQQRCLESGADRFFTKPISLEILKSAIAGAISTRDTMRNKFSKDIDYGYNEIHMADTRNQLIDKVISIIRANMENTEFSVEDLSHEVGMSRVHLNRKLKELMNISPSNLIRSIRLKQAAFLLLNNRVNISEVAYRVGFSTHSYFSNSFHDYFGMTPKEFVAKYMDCKDEETLKKIFE